MVGWLVGCGNDDTADNNSIIIFSLKTAVKYQWLKGDTRTFVRPQMQQYIFISANGRLYFSEVTRVDEGEYRCIAILSGVSKYTLGTSQPPTRTSMAIQLVVQDQGSYVIDNDVIARVINNDVIAHKVCA